MTEVPRERRQEQALRESLWPRAGLSVFWASSHVIFEIERAGLAFFWVRAHGQQATQVTLVRGHVGHDSSVWGGSNGVLKMAAGDGFWWQCPGLDTCFFNICGLHYRTVFTENETPPTPGS